MFSDSQAKKFVVKNDKLFCQWRNFLRTKFYADFFSSNKLFRTLSNIYDEEFYSESFVTMAYLGSWYIQNLWHIKHSRHSKLPRIYQIQFTDLCIFTTLYIQALAYWKSEEYSKLCQTCMMDHFLQKPCVTTLTY